MQSHTKPSWKESTSICCSSAFCRIIKLGPLKPGWTCCDTNYITTALFYSMACCLLVKFVHVCLTECILYLVFPIYLSVNLKQFSLLWTLSPAFSLALLVGFFVWLRNILSVTCVDLFFWDLWEIADIDIICFFYARAFWRIYVMSFSTVGSKNGKIFKNFIFPFFSCWIFEYCRES